MPLPSTRQSHMSTFHGKAACLDDNKQIDNIAFKQHVVAKTAAYSCLNKESGTVFTTEGAAGTVIFTLPAIADNDGTVYWFACMEDYILRLTAPAGKLVCGNNAAATSVSFQTTDNMVGSGFMAVCNGSFWYAFPYRGQSDATITVA